MTGTHRHPRRHPRKTWNITHEIVSIYAKIRSDPPCGHDVLFAEASSRCPSCVEWWKLHHQLSDVLDLPPHFFPAFFLRPDVHQTEQQALLKHNLDAALAELKELEPVSGLEASAS